MIVCVGVYTHIHALNDGRSVSLDVFSPHPCSVFAELQPEEVGGGGRIFQNVFGPAINSWQVKR